MTKICIIGAGWYGCHIGVSLKALGFDVMVLEKNEQILAEASGKNQFRLHQGFHYPRHHTTRVQSRDGFIRFMAQYPDLSRRVPDNFYAVSQEESLMDFLTYRLVMTSSGLSFQEASPPGLQGVSGMLVVDERVLLTERARQFFKSRLGDSLVTGVEVKQVATLGLTGAQVNGEPFDWVVDATWGHRGLPIPVFYEPTILLYYETAGPQPAITLVDGPLCSVYPTEDPGIYTLTSVPHTPLGRYSNAAEAISVRNHVNYGMVTDKRQAMEDQITRYLPDFRDRFSFAGPQLSLKTKPVGSFDDRSCYVFRNGRIITVMSGKIDTIFFALERIITELVHD